MIAALSIVFSLSTAQLSLDAAKRNARLVQAEAQPGQQPTQRPRQREQLQPAPNEQQTPPAEQPPRAYVEEPLPPGFARVHLLSDDPDVRLYRTDVKRYDKAPNPLPKLLLADEMVCSAPCGITVDVRPGQNLYIGGPGMPSTPKFNLVGRSGDVVIDVHGGNYGELVLGYIGSWGGLVTALLGGSVLVVGLLLRPSSDQFLRTFGNIFTVGGGIGLGVGVVFGLTGMYLVHDGRTRYEVLPSGTRPPGDVPATLEL